MIVLPQDIYQYRVGYFRTLYGLRSKRLANSIYVHKKRLKASTHFSTLDYLLAIHHFEGKCCYCDKRMIPGKENTPDCMTLDLFIPHSRGGLLVPGNVVVACYECNQNKYNALPFFFLMQYRYTAGIDRYREIFRFLMQRGIEGSYQGQGNVCAG